MRILFVLPFYYPLVVGGAEISSKEFAEELVRRGHDVFVLTFKVGKIPANSVVNGVSICRIPFFGRFRGLVYLVNCLPVSLYFAWYVKRFVAKNNIDVVHCQSSMSIVPVTLSGVKNPFLTLRDHGIGSYGIFMKELWYKSKLLFFGLGGFLLFDKWLRNRFLHRFNVVCVSEYVRGFLGKSGFRGRSCVVYNLIPSVTKDIVKSESGGGFVFAGSLCHEKGFDLLMNSLSYCRNKFRFDIFGNDRSISGDNFVLGSEDQEIVFHGVRPNCEVLEYIANCRAVVVPSVRDEPLSRGIIEALALGKPVVVTDTGGSREVIDDKSGRVSSVECKDLARCLDEVFEGGFDSVYCRSVAERFFGLHNVDKLLGFYGECV